MLQVLRSFFSLVVPIALLAIHFAVMLCFINRWDTMATVTLVPIWMWAVIGIVLGFFGWVLFKSRLSLLVLLIWLTTAVICSDETPALLRSVKNWVLPADAADPVATTPATDPKAPDKKLPGSGASEQIVELGIVTLNCDGKDDAPASARALAEQLIQAAGGSASGTQEGEDGGSSTIAAEPFDVVFLQEAPNDKLLGELTQLLFGAKGTSISHQGCAILARGRLEPIELQFDFPNTLPGTQVAALLELEPGITVELVNVHLKRSIVRFDVWRSDAWKAQTAMRVTNRTRLKGILKALPQRPVKRPRIVGGDFGTPYNDDIFRILQRDHVDAFRDAGTGWGNTYPAKFPVLRIDQIWAGTELTPLEASALPVAGSDHRQVRVRFQFKPTGGFLASN